MTSGILNVKVKLTVDDETAMTCLKLLEMYINSTNQFIVAKVDDTTRERGLSFMSRGGDR